MDPKLRVAKLIVKDYVTSGMVVGIDSGEMCSMAVQEIAAAIKAGSLKDVTLLPTSHAAASEAAFVGVPITISADHETIDVMFAAVDEIDILNPALPFIFGRSAEPTQPQIPRFKGVARKAKLFVALLDTEEKAVGRLGNELPVVIDEGGGDWEETAEEIDDIVLGEAEVWRRGAAGNDDPRGGDYPYISEEGHAILDVKFYDTLTLGGDPEVEYKLLVNEITAVPGAVSVALLEGVADVLVICNGESPKVVSKEDIAEELRQASTKAAQEASQEA